MMKKKKNYIFPVVEILAYSFPDMMKVGGETSGTDAELPIDPVAPRRGRQMAV